MQDLNEDMDELFRKAIDQYALKPVDNKWDQLSGKIISINRPPSLAGTNRSKYVKRTLLLAIMFLMPFAIAYIMPRFKAFPAANTNTNELKDQKANTNNKPISQIAEPSLTPGETAGHVPIIAHKNKWLFSGNKTIRLHASDISSSSISEPMIKNVSAELISPYDLSLSPILLKNTKTSFGRNESKPIALNTSVNKNLPLQHMDYPRRQGFYAGLAAGPILTQVQHQGLKKSGYDFGMFVGYTLGKKLSIETGLMYTKQYYFVGGKYYNEIAGVDNASSLQGSRTAFEIPLTLKYNVIRMASGNFFVTAGASTYVGVNDKVQITVTEGAIPPSLHFDYGVTSYMPSYVNISVGYEYKIGRFANIRMEPYLQIPLNSNTGNSFKTQETGRSIQVFNSGIRIGISRFIR